RAGRKLLELATSTAKLATRAGLRPLPSPGDESQKKAKVAVALAQRDMVLAVPVYRRFAQPYVALPDAVLDASVTDPGNAPTYRIRPGNVIVFNSGLG